MKSDNPVTLDVYITVGKEIHHRFFDLIEFPTIYAPSKLLRIHLRRQDQNRAFFRRLLESTINQLRLILKALQSIPPQHIPPQILNTPLKHFDFITSSLIVRFPLDVALKISRVALRHISKYCLYSLMGKKTVTAYLQLPPHLLIPLLPPQLICDTSIVRVFAAAVLIVRFSETGRTDLADVARGWMGQSR